MKTLRMYFKDGSTLIIEDCKYIERDKYDYLVPRDKDDHIIGWYHISNMYRYKIEEVD